MVTYERICEKLGFNLDDVDGYVRSLPAYEDDSIPNPFSRLNDEESMFAGNYLRRHYKLARANSNA
jgi:hypothetical protein